MERTIDKLLVFCGCAACLLPLVPGGLGTAGVIMTLLAICSAALSDALPERIRAAMPICYCICALSTPAGAGFIPLALYDTIRDLHRSDRLRASWIAPVASLCISAVLWRPELLTLCATAALSGLAAALSARTSRMLARQATLNRTRDDLTTRARALLDRARGLETRLDDALRHADTTDTASRAAGADESERRPAAFACLTDREYEVARLIAEGLDNREIAAAAYMGEGTVRNHISSILSKMRLNNRTQIAIAFWRG